MTTNLNLGMRSCGIVLLWAAAAIALPAQTTPTVSSAPPIFNAMFSFDFTDGAYPYAGLVQGTDGNLYGTTFGGGCGQGDEGEGCGTVFKITPGGKQEVLYLFCSQGGNLCTDGLLPAEGLIQGTDGNFYGSTSNGGTGYDNDQGTVFRITSSGKLTTLHSFCSDYDPETEECLDGAKPSALIQGADGNFYGVTGAGGDNVYDAGTFFKISSSGTLTTLYNFCSEYKSFGCADGQYPSGLVRGTDGKFYGTTARGGTNSGGTVFSVTRDGSNLTTLYSFCSQPGCTDGYYPVAALVQGRDGKFYGTTSMGGPPPGGAGTVFSITPDGTLTTLHSFEGTSHGEGAYPAAPLILGTDGNFYGTTEYGGSYGNNYNFGGTVFRVTAAGDLSTLYSLCSQGGKSCTDGLQPVGGLAQDTDGTLYGTTAAGGADYLGVVFSLTMGLGPFVETNPVAAKVGKKVGILGTNLTSATNVTFHGVAAEFEVKSPTLIIAEVPTGATSGKVQVQTPNATLTSNVPFIVLPLH